MDAIEILNTTDRMRCKADYVILSMYQLAQLLKGGVGIADALDDVSDMETSRVMQRIWSSLGSSIKSGRSLSDAMSRMPWLFDTTVIALIKAGEKNGELAAACQSVHEYLKWHSSLKSKLATVLVYPVFSLMVFILVIGFLFVSVVPTIENYLVSGGAALPWHTSMLVAMSTWLKEYVHWLVGALAISVVFIYMLVRASKSWRLQLHMRMMHVPVLGRLSVNLSLSRYSHCCATLYGSGITLEESLQLSEKTVKNLALRQQLVSVREAMVRGQGLGESLNRHRNIPVFFRRMVLIGETTGTLESALLQLSNQQQKNSEATIDRIEQLIAPVMLVMIGSCLLWVIVSMLSPVYNTAINAALQS